MTRRPPRLILASRSPRRADLLARLGLEYEVRALDLPEAFDPEDDPAAVAVRLAEAKARAAVDQAALTIGCDTLVVHGGEILGKPRSVDEALKMVCRLEGDEHTVYTAVALASPSRVESAVESTRVWFRSLDPRECAEYVATGEPMDKAGAYGIQGFGAAIVEAIEGDYFNVMGLPVKQLLRLFQRFGYRYAFRPQLVPVEG